METDTPTHTLLACASCNGTFLTPPQVAAQNCPYCGQAGLTAIDESGAETGSPLFTQPPELVLPFAATESSLQNSLTQFVKRTWFAPTDLTPANLAARLQPLFIPMWLVDAKVQAQWQAEVGFNYQVVSHKESYLGGQWRTQEVRETRVRWEPRVGTLQRPYSNQVAPALEEFAQLEHTLGKYRLDQGVRPFQADDLERTFAHLSNRPPADAWPEAEAALKNAAAAECRQAATADHLREFRWKPEFSDQVWTQLLLPLYTSHYQDDEGITRMIYVQGQSGALRGQRRASMHKARRWATIIAAVAAGIFAISLLLALAGYFENRLLPFVGVGMVIALLVGVTAVLPLLLAWYVNGFGASSSSEQQTLAAFLRALKGE